MELDLHLPSVESLAIELLNGSVSIHAKMQENGAHFYSEFSNNWCAELETNDGAELWGMQQQMMAMKNEVTVGQSGEKWHTVSHNMAQLFFREWRRS